MSSMDGNLFQQLAQESCNECTASRIQVSGGPRVLDVGLWGGRDVAELSLILILTCRLPVFQDCNGNCNPKGWTIGPQSTHGSVSSPETGGGGWQVPQPSPEATCDCRAIFKKIPIFAQGPWQAGPSSHGASPQARRRRLLRPNHSFGD